MQVSVSKILLVLYLSIILFSEFIATSFRLFVYILPFIAISVIIWKRNIVFDEFNRLVLAILSIITFSLLIEILGGSHDLFRSIKEFVFIISPFLVFMVVYRYLESKYFDSLIKIFTSTLFLLFIIFNSYELYNLITNFGSFLITSSSDLESTFAFVFGILPVYFLIKKNRFMFLLSIPIALIGSKRIALLAFIIAVISYLIIQFFNFKRSRVKYYALIANASVVFLILNIIYGNIDFLFNDIIGIDKNLLAKGRFAVWDNLLSGVDTNMFVGSGLASTSIYLRTFLSDENYLLMHSDLLKIYIEFGVILGSLFIFLIYKIVEFDLRVLPLLVYFNVLLLTDNTLIYVHVTVFIFLLIANLLKEKSYYYNNGSSSNMSLRLQPVG